MFFSWPIGQSPILGRPYQFVGMPHAYNVTIISDSSVVSVESNAHPVMGTGGKLNFDRLLYVVVCCCVASKHIPNLHVCSIPTCIDNFEMSLSYHKI